MLAPRGQDIRTADVPSRVARGGGVAWNRSDVPAPCGVPRQPQQSAPSCGWICVAATPTGSRRRSAACSASRGSPLRNACRCSARAGRRGPAPLLDRRPDGGGRALRPSGSRPGTGRCDRGSGPHTAGPRGGAGAGRRNHRHDRGAAPRWVAPVSPSPPPCAPSLPRPAPRPVSHLRDMSRIPPVEEDGMPRAIRRGAISFGMVSIPVKLYTATDSKDVTAWPARTSPTRWAPLAT